MKKTITEDGDSNPDSCSMCSVLKIWEASANCTSVSRLDGFRTRAQLGNLWLSSLGR